MSGPSPGARAFALTLTLSFALALSVSCAPRQPATTWGYSEWYQQSGVSMKGAFEEHQKQCLAKLGAGVDPANVVPGSPEERSYLDCMNGTGWCTNAFRCQDSGA